jgi:hypothetical protein
MRAFGSRADTIVCDEPLYAHYLAETGLDHPMVGEIIRRHESDWRAVAAWLTAPRPAGKGVFYQKHMAHHLLPGIERGWLNALVHAFLIREPRAMLASLSQVLPQAGLQDTGLPQQVRLFEEHLEKQGTPPAVIDSRDLLEDPPRILQGLCTRVGIEFTPAMLSWEPGPRETDGVWAQAWYGNALQSTGFQPYRESSPELPARFEALLGPCQELYARLHAHRLR